MYGTDICYYVPTLKKIIFNCEKFLEKSKDKTKTQLDNMFRQLSADLKELCHKIKLNEVVIELSDDNPIALLYVNYIKKRKIRVPKFIIIKSAQRITDDEKKLKILNDFHIGKTAGHVGISRMTRTIRQYYYWRGLNSDVQEYVNKCEICKKTKHHRTIKHPLTVTTTAQHALDKLYLDLVGPLPRDQHENEYILTIQCELSKFVIAKPIKDKRASTVAQAFVECVILKFGIPTIIATDRGSEFVAQVMKDVADLLGIQRLTSTAYHHESIGALENAHKTLGNFLRANSTEKRFTWSEWIPYWTFMYNTTVHSSHGYTPFELVFGRKCILPSLMQIKPEPLYNFEDYAREMKYRIQIAHKEARERLVESKIKQNTESEQNVKKITFQTGQKIFLKKEGIKKLELINEGPFEVIQDLGANILINRNSKVELVHKNRTILYKGG